MKTTGSANDNDRPLNLLPGVPEAMVRSRFEKAAGNEIDSGTIFSPESSAALVANTFGWFLERPHLLPCLPGLDEFWFEVQSVDLERCIRFPWSGGRHPRFDAIVETEMHTIGIEAKRCEPFRRHSRPQFSAAFDRDVWGNGMGPYLRLRDQLRNGAVTYRFLDAAQLVKHALAMSVECTRSGKLPILYYLFHEPYSAGGRSISLENWIDHRHEIFDFASRTEGAQVAFFSSDCTEWLSDWDEGEAAVKRHGRSVLRYLILSEVRKLKAGRMRTDSKGNAEPTSQRH